MKVNSCEFTSMCLDRQGEDVRVGARVRTGSNSLPVFRIIAIEGDKTWLRDENSGADYIAPLCRCVAAREGEDAPAAPGSPGVASP